MQEIFDKKAILKNEKGQVNFDLFHEISSNLGGDLTDTFFIFKQNPKTALNLNRKDGFLTDILNKMDILTTEVNFFETILAEIKEKFPLVLAPLCLHKAENIKEVLIQIKSLLTKNGIFVGNFFGLSSLEELGILLASEDISICGQPLQRILPLMEIKTIGMLLSGAGFKNVVVQNVPISFNFANLKEALYFLKQSGEGNVLKLREKSLISGNVLKKYLEKYKKPFTLKFEVCFFSCHL